MDRQYKEALAALNDQQRLAVETIDGPVLVIAGPGTGKTQLISTRVGYILNTTDTPADAILLLTFTEAGVQAMRERLNRLIGRAAYDVQLSTYHAFGGEIFRRYPDYFEGAELSLIEELGSDSLLRSIVAKLPYSNPLKFADNYINELRSFISESKRALLSPADIDAVARDNLTLIREVNRTSKEILAKLSLVSKGSVPHFEKLGTKLGSTANLARYAAQELEAALEYFNEAGKTTQITGWKRQWLAKDAKGRTIFDGQRQNQRLQAAAGIYKTYQRELKRRRLYDYDDMILRAIETLEAYPELKYSLAERYSYIMLDEFQDTNPAQFRLVELLTDHPVHEGRPNVLAVGDDDQAIYAFQGADHANMASFASHYKNVKVIGLTDNYRSHQPLLEVGQNIASQIQNRLHAQFKGLDKSLTAANKELPGSAHISAREFKSDAAQYKFIADELKKLSQQGVALEDMAVLAPKHRYLEPLLPYLSSRKLPVYYERRENILDEPVVHQLEQMSRLIIALADGNERLANSLWPEVLSYDFWRVPTDRIWRISWQSSESRQPWTEILLNDETLNQTADFFLRLAATLPTTTLEQQLDVLVGVPKANEELKLPSASPLYEYYFSKKNSAHNPVDFARLINDLNVLRSQLRSWRQANEDPVGLRAFVDFVDGHRAANLNILNTSPYHETRKAVNLLTAYGAKGREFKAVFIIAAVDEVWGSSSRNQGYRLSLPANLSYIRYQGASEDERLRLLYVATTRAQTHLYLTSYSQDLAGRNYNRLKYLDIQEDQDNGPIVGVLPAKSNRLKLDTNDSLPVTATLNYWTRRHLPPLNSSLKQALAPKLENYGLSATHLNQFTDIVNAGPDDFFMKSLLNFPSAPSVTQAFGTAMHNSLRFAGNILAGEGTLPKTSRLLEIFEAQLGRVELPGDELDNLLKRGQASLRVWLERRGKDLKATDRFEYDFQNEGSISGPARLTGKVDRLVIDEKTRSVAVVDYKTGQSYQRWQSSVIKLHKFRQQLLFYKLLVESSARFRNYKVDKGIIEFVEPDEDGQISQLETGFARDELEQAKQLISGVWASIQSLNFPETTSYQPAIGGIKKFEADLRNQKRRS